MITDCVKLTVNCNVNQSTTCATVCSKKNAGHIINLPVVIIVRRMGCVVWLKVFMTVIHMLQVSAQESRRKKKDYV